jgi:hypothetical protein
MSAITKEQAQSVSDLKAGYTLGHADVAILNELARIALASLEAKPIGAFHIADQQVGGTTDYIKDGEWPIDDGVIEVYAAPPAPVVPEEMPKGLAGQIVSLLAHNIGDKFLAQKIWNACRAAMLQGADGNSPVNQDGWVMVPMRLTAENGAKSTLSGEFSETKFINCPECFGDDDCETCDGSGRIEIKVPVSWTTIKEIWAKGIEHFAAAPQQEVK